MNLRDLRQEFADDQEFLKLCDRHEQIDLSVASLELARDYYPELDFDETLVWIEERADEIRQQTSAFGEPFSQLEYLADLLAGQHGLRGDNAAFREASGSFLNSVITSRRGIPISLSVLYMAVANRAGIDLQGVAAPAHFLTRLETIEGPLFLDAFTPGRYFRYDDCVDWLQSIADVSRRDARSGLKPVNHRTIITRMLNNLKVLYIEQQDWMRALRIQNRLLLLSPTQYASRRDLAIISLHAGLPGEALSLFRKVVSSAPESEQQMLREQMAISFREITRWN